MACGNGCPSCRPDMACYYQSESQPTGICLPTANANNTVVGEHGDRCFRDGNPCMSGLTCLQSLYRMSAPLVHDALRIGVCVPREDCAAMVRAFPDRFRCQPGV